MTAEIDCAVPPRLLAMQQWFAKSITHPLGQGDTIAIDSIKEKARDYISPSPTLQPHQRVELYAQQYWWRLLRILRKNFPLLLRLLGPSGFHHAVAVPYLCHFPSNHWSVDSVGHRLSFWIEKESTLEDQEFLASAARVDSALHEGFFVKKYPGIPQGSLSDWMGTPLTLQPHVRLFSLPYNLFAYREELLQQTPEYWLENVFPTLPDEKTYAFIVYRDSRCEMVWEEISEQEFSLLQFFEKEAAIEDASSWYAQQEGGVQDFSAWIHKWIALRWLYPVFQRAV